MKEKLQAFLHWAWQPHRRPKTILMGTLLFVIFLIFTKPQSASVESTETTYSVEATTVYPMPIPSSLYLYGMVEAPEKTTLVSTVSSHVHETLFKEGMRVHAGDVLVALDALEPELVYKQRAADLQESEALIIAEENRYQNDIAALAHEEALLALYTKSLDREKQLAQKKMGSEANVDKAQQSVETQALVVETRMLSLADHPARLAQLQARYEKASALEMQAKIDLSRTQIMSPYNARVAKVHVSPLERVQIGSPLVDIFKSDDLEVRVQIPTRYIDAFEKSRADNLPIRARAIVDGKNYPLVFSRLTSESDPGHGGVDAFFTVDKNAPHLSLGRPVDVVLELPSLTSVIAIPVTALHGHDHVFKIENNRLVNVSVELTGERLSKGTRQYLITSPHLKPGDTVLTSLLPNAVSGIRVNIVEPK